MTDKELNMMGSDLVSLRDSGYVDYWLGCDWKAKHVSYLIKALKAYREPEPCEFCEKEKALNIMTNAGNRKSNYCRNCGRKLEQ